MGAIMYSYTIMQWLFFFYFYCFFGWCFESTYVSLKKKRWVNRGFMRGPFLPLYGSGAIMMLVVSMPFKDNLLLVYIAGCLGATVLEYVTGVVMEALFKVRYWDYSKNRFNFQGHICLGSSLFWGVLTILMTEVLHKPVERLASMIPGGILTAVTLLLTAYICSDFALSFKAALDLKNVLLGMEKAKEELLRVQRRLEIIATVTADDLESRKEEFTESLNQKREELTESWGIRIEELKHSIEEKLDGLRNMVLSKPSDYPESEQEELRELHRKYHASAENHDKLSHVRDFYQKGLLRDNPTMSSSRFKDALEELKRMADKKGKD